ncbi:MAG: hypothetical protein KGH58_04475, partial [Candidatus Micrarchaeota archaeon]|nr:hypothetical protein [Candidatus Micrarchaeota archaeon]
MKVDGAYLMFALVLAAVSLILIIPPQSYAANATSAAPQLQRVTGGAGQCVIPKSKDCPASSIAGENIAGHIISCGYCQPACGLMCSTGGPSDGGEASSIGCVGTFVGGGSYSSSQTTYCNGGYDNSFSMSLPSGSYANYECSDAPAQASYNTGGSGWYDQGQCQITNYNDTTTHYPDALNGQIVPAQPSPVSQSPMITNVLNDNTANALWLLSCPSSPGGGAAEYFSSNLASFLGGDMCLANNAPLTSGAKVTTSVSWGPTTPPNGILDNITFTNIATGTINDIAYSGATNAIASSTFDISNGYNTQSYIFQQVPAQAQHGVWGWNAKRANFSGFNTVILSQWQNYASQSFDGGSSFAFIQNFDQSSYQWTCSYSYKLSTSINIQSIQNANIPLDSNGGSPVSVLPYFLYNISLPSTTSELNYAPTNAVLNLSLDLYSPHNFQSPQQNLDPFPFYTDAGFFAGQSSSGG